MTISREKQLELLFTSPCEDCAHRVTAWCYKRGKPTQIVRACNWRTQKKTLNKEKNETI